MMKYLKIPIITLLAVGHIYMFTLPVSALSGSQFNAGRIIDDFVFTNSNSMSVTDIQDFLNAKVPNCDSNGLQLYAGTTRASYSRSHGHPLPLVCLRDYYENPATLANNLTVTDGQVTPVPTGAKSAAQLIKDVSVQYNINPQVLLVLLQKEQGLVTDDWPWSTQFQKATGYGCPDTAACDSQYYGFYNQIASAAWQFNAYKDNPTYFNFRSGITRSIQYNPNASCGSGSVFLQNQSTASLYNYTPYQPNAAALANLTGTGDGCSAYGNRNFWYYFNTWFGTTYANDTNSPHPNGTLIKDASHVYVMEAGGRRLIASGTIFDSYGYAWDRVKPASTGDLNLPIIGVVADLAPGTLATGDDGKIYIISSLNGVAQKQWLSYNSYVTLGYNGSQVQHVSQNELPSSTLPNIYTSTQHPSGSLVVLQGNVYLVNTDNKQYVDPLAFASNFYRWNMITNGTTTDATLSSGDIVSLREGTILYSNGSIYSTQRDDGGLFKRPLGPWECYHDRLHYSPADWYDIPATLLPMRTGTTFTC